MKRCRTCKTEKPLNQFKKNRRKSDGRDTVCKACYKIANRRYNLNYRNTPKGAAVLAWSRIRYRCGNRNGDFPGYESVENRFTRDQFMAWAVPEYQIWMQAHGTTIGASVDRIKTCGHYESGNIRLIATDLNSALACKERKNPTAELFARRILKTCNRVGLEIDLVLSELIKLPKNNKKPAQVCT